MTMKPDPLADHLTTRNGRRFIQDAEHPQVRLHFLGLVNEGLHAEEIADRLGLSVSETLRVLEVVLQPRPPRAQTTRRRG